jgi:hypothetical protein
VTAVLAWFRLLAVGACLGALTVVVNAEQTPTFSLVDSDITIESGATAGRGSMLLKADNVDAASLTKQLGDIQDLKTPSPPPVEVKFAARELDRSDTTRRWVLTVDVSGLPRNVMQKRYLSFPFNGQIITLAYTITNKSTATFTWTVKSPPAELNLAAGEPIEVGIAVQAVAATNVRVLQTALVEQSRKTPLDGGLMLCKQPGGSCGADIDLAANSSNRLWLRSNSGGAIVGKYTGTVSIGASEKPDGDTLNLTIYGTTLCRQLIGALLILAGVVCAWIVSTWSRSRLDRAQSLLPAALLAERVTILQQKLANAPPDTDEDDRKETTRALNALAKGLSETGLDGKNYLPRALPNPFVGLGPNIDGYKQFLADAGTKVALLDLLVDDGFVAVWKKIQPPPDAKTRQAVHTASKALDAKILEDPLPSTKDLITFIESTLKQLNDDLAAGHPGTAAALAAQQRPIQPRSLEQIVVEIRNLSALTWIVFGILATAVGVHILVIGNLGFGLPADYFTCLFWGFGLPISAQQLVQSTIGSVGTALGVTVPKTSAN